ncbi:MAG: isochorismatase family protein [Actinomycetes bacterium]|jgi:nicotinamidase-related amidase|nr:isochorismatase family protein [Actinomycetes bacterium]
MTSIKPIRDPETDHLLTPENCALLVIDYQATQVNSINSMLHDRLVDNIVFVVRVAKTYGLPIVLSTVNVETKRNTDTIPRLKEALGEVVAHDRTAINAWEDREFLAAVQATGRRKLIICALWTEACMSLPTLDALREGYEVYPVVDAVGGTSVDAHRTALRRVEQAGAQLTSLAHILCELQRDWDRDATEKEFLQLMLEAELFNAL